MACSAEFVFRVVWVAEDSQITKVTTVNITTTVTTVTEVTTVTKAAY
jgi:hypothetical protein